MKGRRRNGQTGGSGGTGGSGKITPFPTLLETPEMLDETIRENLKREADEIEEWLNTDPNMVGVGASEDLFLKIKATLQEQGIWEEDPQEETGAESQEHTEAEGGKGAAGKGEAAAFEETAKNAGDMGESRRTEEIGEIESIGRHTEAGETESGREAENVEMENGGEAENAGGTGDTAAAGNVEIIRSLADSGNEKNLEDIYKMLPEEDLRALELGRRTEEENKKKAEKQKKRWKKARYAGVAAAAVLVVCGVSMSTEASRKLILQSWSVVLENLGLRTRTNYADAADLVKIRDSKEYQAIQDISDKLDISPIYFQHLPEGMKFSEYNIYAEDKEAVLFYNYESQRVFVWMNKSNGEQINYLQVDEGEDDVEIIMNYQNIEVRVEKANTEKKETYMAQFTWEDCNYTINGMISYQEMKEVIKNLIILEN